MRAFRRAAAQVSDVPLDILRRLSETGRLRSLPGIGEVMERVIVEALGGEAPAYLQRLESEGEPPEDERARLIRTALLGDLHTHSDWSDGGSPIEEMAVAARDLGHAYIALTDHSPRLTVARGLSAERLQEQLQVVAGLNERLAPFRILTGIEVDINEDGSLDQDETLLRRVDTVVGSVHSKLRMESEPMTRRMVAAIANPNMDVLGHCTGRIVVGRGRPQSTFDADVVFAACARFGVAVEINSRPERLDPPDDLLARARDAGCIFAINTDAHAPGQLAWQRYGCEKAASASIPIERIVNARPLEGVLAWAGRRL